MGASPFLPLLLLLMPIPGVLGSHPGLITRITSKGLEYVAKEGLVALQRELRGIRLPDFTGEFKLNRFVKGNYEFYRLNVRDCELPGATLTAVPGHRLSLSISNAYLRVQGEWKARKSFVRLQGSFDVKVKGITISANLLLGVEPSGRPTVIVSRCSSHIQDVEVDISGNLGWLLNLFHNSIESRFRRELENKICEMVQEAVTSDLQTYLRTVPVITEIDSPISVDYSLVEAPQTTTQSLDVWFKGEIFHNDHRTPVSLFAPTMSLPEEHQRMVYFAISDYVFNTASLACFRAGYLNFSITDDLVPPSSSIRLTTKFFRTFSPRLGKRYPNMNLELEGTMESAPFLNFTPGNLSLTPQMAVEGFVLLPDAVREPVFRLGVVTNISATLTFNDNKITGFLEPGKVQVELKESKVGMFNVEMLEALLNVYILDTLYPKINEKLARGLPLPLPDDIQLYDLILQIHKDFLLVATNVQYMRD